jgi:hypothetical protein
MGGLRLLLAPLKEGEDHGKLLIIKKIISTFKK